MLRKPRERVAKVRYEPRCEACRYSRFIPRYAVVMYLHCEKSNSVTARSSSCDKFHREPGADDEKTGDRDER